MTDDSPDGAAGALFPDSAATAPASPGSGPVETTAPAPYRVLARKYRPKNFEELIGQDVMVRILSNAFAMGRVHQAYMLTGVRGVGKTTTARILARALNYELAPRDGQPGVTQPTVHMPELGVHCQAIIDSRHVDVIEMDAASHTGVDDVREIIEGARYKPATARMKVYIIDEVHMLSKSAFNALLKTLEEPPEHVKFIFATTEIDRVPVTVRSRCLRFDLRRVEPDVLVRHLQGICTAEGVSVAQDGLALIARASEGSVRDSLSLLDQAIAHGGSADGSLGGAQRIVPAEEVRAMLGLADRMRVVELFGACMRGDVASAIANLQSQYEEGADPAQVLLEVAEFTHLTTRVKIAPDVALTAMPPEEFRAAQDFAQRLSMSVLNRSWQILIKGVSEARESARPLAAADMVLVRLAYAADLPTPDEALRKLGFGASGGSAQVPAPSRAGGPSHAASPAQNFSSAASTPAASTPAVSTSAMRVMSGGAYAFAPEQRTQAGAPQVKTVAPPQTAASPAQFLRLEDVIAKAAAERDIQLKLMLERDVRLVRFERGQIEFSLAPGGSPQLAQTLIRRLQDWTGERWMVAISTREGAPSLAERARVQEQALEQDASAHPLVRAVLERFPGAKIVTPARSVYEQDFTEPAAEPDSADDVIYADDDFLNDDD